MMIIDADTHISPTGQDFEDFSLEAHMARMARSGVDKTLTWLKPDYQGTGIEGHNAYVYQAMQQYPDQILGFGWADPTVSVEHAIEMVHRCVDDYGMYGVKLNGAQNHYYIDDPDLALPVIDEIARTGKLLAFHIGPDAYERTHPFRAAKVARMYPDMDILMVHMGMTNNDMNDAVIEMAQECPNMYLVGSATTTRAVLKAIGLLGADRVCFGTDAPFQIQHVVRATYDALLEDELSQEEKALVMGGNIARLFGL
ncbi:MAG: amidohydrolase family protein [Anaerolineae bacterium]